MLAARIRKTVRTAACAVLVAIPAWANINLEWRPLSQTVEVGDLIEIEIWAVSDSSADQMFSAAQTIITWDPAYLRLTGSYDTFWVSGFLPSNSFGFNEANPPADGNGMWSGMLSPGMQRPATPSGTLLTTITFEVVALPSSTYVEILPSLQLPGHPMGFSKVMSGTMNVIGEIGPPALVQPVCFGDLNEDRRVNISDLAILLSTYGTPSGATYEMGDLDGDGDVDLSDLAALLALYGTICD